MTYHNGGTLLGLDNRFYYMLLPVDSGIHFTETVKGFLLKVILNETHVPCLS